MIPPVLFSLYSSSNFSLSHSSPLPNQIIDLETPTFLLPGGHDFFIRYFLSFWTFPSLFRINIPDTYKPRENSHNIPWALPSKYMLFRCPSLECTWTYSSFFQPFTVLESHFILPFQCLLFVCMNDLFLRFIGLLGARNLVYNSKKVNFSLILKRCSCNIF